MTGMIILIILLMAVLIGLVIKLRQQSRKYEEKSVKETMSPIMHSIIRRERTVNLQRKQRFEKSLAAATDPQGEARERPDKTSPGENSHSS